MAGISEFAVASTSGRPASLFTMPMFRGRILSAQQSAEDVHLLVVSSTVLQTGEGIKKHLRTLYSAATSYMLSVGPEVANANSG